MIITLCRGMSLSRKRKLTCEGKTGFWGPSESFWGFQAISQQQNMNLQIILLGVLDHWTLMYKMIAVDKPWWSFLKRLGRVFHCQTLVSWKHRLQPQLSRRHAVLLLKSSKSTITIIDSLFSPITLLNRVSCAFRVCMSLLGLRLYFCMHAILIWCWVLSLKK